MVRRLALVVAALMLAAFQPGAAIARPASAGPSFSPGAAGIGDPYFPLDGNGGYDVGHYALEIGFDPATTHIAGVATIQATATENLSSFNLDLLGLNVLGISVDGRNASWSRDAAELTVTPSGTPYIWLQNWQAHPSPHGRPQLKQAPPPTPCCTSPLQDREVGATVREGRGLHATP